jgi:phage terminase Nu1 subunit (DNA packaging protein)
MVKENTPRQTVYYKYINGEHCLSTGAMCNILDTTKETLSVWADKGCPKVKRGYWVIKNVLQWRGLVSASGIRTEEGAKLAEDKIAFQAQKMQTETQLKQAQLDALNLKNDISSGKYLQREEVLNEFNKLMIVLKKSMLSIKNKIGVEAAAFLDDEKVKILMNSVEEVVINSLESMSINGLTNEKH